MPNACTPGLHHLRPRRHAPEHLAKLGQVPWPFFAGNEQLVSTSPSGRVVVWVDSQLGSEAIKNATDLLANADRLVAYNDSLFGPSAGAVNVIVYAIGGATDGSGGAVHDSCDFQTGQNIEVCAAYGNSPIVFGLFIAEFCECCMNNNLCGNSVGEALSRWIANEESGGQLGVFATAPTWFQAGMPDWVTKVEATDQDGISTGCGMAFLSWLLSLGQKLPDIAKTVVLGGDAGTWDLVYFNLGAGLATDALPKFTAAIAALPNGVVDDDPFAGIAPPTPPPPGPPSPPPTTGPALTIILNGSQLAAMPLSSVSDLSITIK